MDEVKIEILGVEFAESLVKSRLDVLGSMEGIPKLGSQPEVFTGNTTGFDGLADFFFVLNKFTY